MSNEAGGRPPFSKFVAVAVGILAVLWLLGYLPTVRFAGESAVVPMVVGGLVSLAASLAGTVPILLAAHKPATESVPSLMGAIALRLAVALVLSLALALSGLLAVEPFLLWVAISHAGLLIADTYFAKAHMRAKLTKR